MRLVLDGIEDRSYKPAHIVRLYGGVPKVYLSLINEKVKSEVQFRSTPCGSGKTAKRLMVRYDSVG